MTCGSHGNGTVGGHDKPYGGALARSRSAGMTGLYGSGAPLAAQ